MRLKKINNYCLTAILFLCLAMLLSFLPAFGSDEKTEAEKLYNDGMGAFNQKRWSLAVEKFNISYDLFPHSTIAYMISCTYVEIGDPWQAEKFANFAIAGNPQLDEPYKSDAKAIIKWAADAKNDNYYVLRGAADAPGRPKSPKVQPPKPSTPKNKALVQKPIVGKYLGLKVIVETNLTGKWSCNDGGRYFLRKVGNELWWFGQSQDGGKSWTNVFHGKIRGGKVAGNWADVPPGKILNSGKMTLTIVNNKKLKAIHKTGGFGGNEWTR